MNMLLHYLVKCKFQTNQSVHKLQQSLTLFKVPHKFNQLLTLSQNLSSSTGDKIADACATR